MKPQISLIIIGLLCAVCGSLIWLLSVQLNQNKYTIFDSYISEPFCLNIEQNDSFYPISKENLPDNIKLLIVIEGPPVLCKSEEDQELAEKLSSQKTKTVFYYDKNKNLLKRSDYGDGELGGEWIFQYDSKGNRVADKNTVSLPYAIYNYNKGNMTNWNHYNNDGSLGSSGILKYDDKNRLIEEFRQNASGRRWGKYIYSYNRNGQKILTSYYDSELNWHKKNIYIYNNSGQLIERIEFYENGVVATGERTVYSYNNKGFLIEEISYYAGGDFNKKITCCYDEKGNKIEEKRFSNPDTPFFKIIYKYNDTNKLIKRVFYSIWTDPQSKKEHITSAFQTIFEYEFYEMGKD